MAEEGFADLMLGKPRLRVAFDVDDPLIVPAVATGFDRDVPNYETIAVYRWFQAQGAEMTIWSGGGADYARQWADKLGLTADYYEDKHDAAERNRQGGDMPHIAFDDSAYLSLATVNVQVKRVNNGVVRHPERVAHAESVRRCWGCWTTASDGTIVVGCPEHDLRTTDTQLGNAE